MTIGVLQSYYLSLGTQFHTESVRKNDLNHLNSVVICSFSYRYLEFRKCCHYILFWILIQSKRFSIPKCQIALLCAWSLHWKRFYDRRRQFGNPWLGFTYFLIPKTPGQMFSHDFQNYNGQIASKCA